MIKNLFVIICAFSFLLLLSQTTRACSCPVKSLKEAFSSSDAVFIGKVVKIKIVKAAKIGAPTKESGALESPEPPRWERSFDKMRSVTLKVVERLKGAAEKTFTVMTAVDDGGGNCGVRFKAGKNFLVFAGKTQSLLSAEEAAPTSESRTPELRLKAEADEFNKPSSFETSVCAKTGRARFMKNEIIEIRGFLKTGVWVSLPENSEK